MRKVFFYQMILLVLTCADKPMSHTETSREVVESFYNKDNTKLKSNTTPDSYESFLAVQDVMTSENPGASNFKVLEEMIEGDVAWVKFQTSYEEKPETFKLIMVDGKWKVAEMGLREETPF